MHRTPPARLLIAGAVALSRIAAADTGPAPTAVVRQLIDAVRHFKEDKGALTAEDKRTNDQARKLADETLAIREVCEKALGDQWNRLRPAERSDFVTLVTNLFEKIAYPKSSGFFGDLQIQFDNERVTGDQAVVQTTVRHPKEGLVSIEYHLQRGASRWVIHDILLDEVSLATDLRGQIQKVLREESYARLLQRMRDKLNEG